MHSYIGSHTIRMTFISLFTISADGIFSRAIIIDDWYMFAAHYNKTNRETFINFSNTNFSFQMEKKPSVFPCISDGGPIIFSWLNSLARKYTGQMSSSPRFFFLLFLIFFVPDEWVYVVLSSSARCTSE